MQRLLFAAAALLSNVSLRAEAFGTTPSSLLAIPSSFQSPNSLRVSALADDYDFLPPKEGESANSNDNGAPQRNSAETANLKRSLYQLAASFDRGFGATPKACSEADDIIRQLAAMNPTECAARGIDGDSREAVPLKAIWRMIWTSAFDVVSLGASPFAAPSAIYQDISNPPVATNIIDLIPRAQTSLPSSMSPPSLLRVEVTTRALSRSGAPNRVGLLFESVTLRPIELLGQRVSGLPPLSIDLGWPRNLLEGLSAFVPGLEGLGLGKGANDPDRPGYFDVEYLDDELLIIRQQVPGGVFALVNVDNCEP